MHRQRPFVLTHARFIHGAHTDAQTSACTRVAVLHHLEEDNIIMYRDGAIHRI